MEHVLVVFTQGEGNQWWKKIVPQGFGHCFVIKPICVDHFWLIIDPLESHTDVVEFPKNCISLEELLPNDAKVLKIYPKIDNKRPVFPSHDRGRHYNYLLSSHGVAWA